VAQHYMDKKRWKGKGLIKNKVVAQFMVANVEKAFMIPTHQCGLANTNVSAWLVQNQHHLGVTYNFHAPFTKYASYTCEWALCKNLCKHQIVIFITCTNLISNNIIEYCGTWYGTNYNGFKTMFANLANGPFSYDGVDNHEIKRSFTPIEWTLCWLQDTMAKITHKYKELTSVQLCDYATSLLQIVASKIQILHVIHVSESMHLNMIFNQVEDDLGNLVNQLTIGMKLCWNMQIPIARGLESKRVL